MSEKSDSPEGVQVDSPTHGNDLTGPEPRISHTALSEGGPGLRILDPSRWCVYCGDTATRPDKFLNKSLTMVGVPACPECRRLLRGHSADTIADRRRHVRTQLKERHRRLLAMPPWTDADLMALGPHLRSAVLETLQRQAHLRARLAWPGVARR
jgi:hypothetical protein